MRVQAQPKHEEVEECERKLHGSRDKHIPQWREHSQQRVGSSQLFSAAFSFHGLLSLDDKAAYTAVYDRYSSQSATFLFFFARSADNLLLRMFSPSLGDVSVSAPVRSFLSHFSASSCFDWA